MPSPSATPTPTPSVSSSPAASPSPSPNASSGDVYGTFLVVISDDFSSPSSGFPTSDFATQRVVYDLGQLQMELKSAAQSLWTMRDFGDWPLADIEATMVPTDPTGSGYFGLACGRSNDDFYAGLLGSSGDALLLRIADRVARPLATVPNAVAPLVANVPLSMKLSCVGTDSGAAAGLILSVGGQVVASGVDSSGFTGLLRAGFYAESGPTSAHFEVTGDDFRVTVGLQSAPGAGPSATPSLTGDPLADLLATHVPETIRGNCRKADIPPFTPTVGITCDTGASTALDYLQYPDRASMDAAYASVKAAHPEATGSSCSAGAGNGPYDVDGVPVGNVICFGSSDALTITWTDDRLDVLSIGTAQPTT